MAMETVDESHSNNSCLLLMLHLGLNIVGCFVSKTNQFAPLFNGKCPLAYCHFEVKVSLTVLGVLTAHNHVHDCLEARVQSRSPKILLICPKNSVLGEF